MTDIRLGSSTFEVVEAGPRPCDAPTILFMHDGLGSAGLWRDFPNKLSQLTGFGAIAFSRLGYGNSSRCELPRPVDYMEREATMTLPAIIGELGIRKHLLFGHSDGGTIALLNALHMPCEGLMGVITEAAHVFCEELTLNSIRLAAAEFASGDLRQKLARHHADVDCAFEGWRSMWLNPDFSSFDFRSDLKTLDFPVLGIQGRDDEYGTDAQLEAIGSAPKSKILFIDSCGHTPRREKEWAVIEASVDFIKNLPK